MYIDFGARNLLSQRRAQASCLGNDDDSEKCLVILLPNGRACHISWHEACSDVVAQYISSWPMKGK